MAEADGFMAQSQQLAYELSMQIFNETKTSRRDERCSMTAQLRRCSHRALPRTWPRITGSGRCLLRTALPPTADSLLLTIN